MTKSLKTFWLACERLATAGVMREWEKEIRDPDVLAAAKKLLTPMEHLAEHYPCTNEDWCTCSHEVIKHKDGMMVAICTCEEGECDPIPVTKSDLVRYQVDFPKVFRGLCNAAGVDLCFDGNLDLSKPVRFGSLITGPVSIPVHFSLASSGGTSMKSLIELLAVSYEPVVLFTVTPIVYHINSRNPWYAESRLVVSLADLFAVTEDKNVVINRELRSAFENFSMKATRVGAARDILEAPQSLMPPANIFRQTDNFHNVWIHGKKLPTLSDMQADMVRVLYEALQNGETELRFAAIAVRMKEPPGRFDNVFRADDKRREAIRTVRRGVFKLAM